MSTEMYSARPRYCDKTHLRTVSSVREDMFYIPDTFIICEVF